MRERDPQNGTQAIAAADLYEQTRLVERRFRDGKTVQRNNHEKNYKGYSKETERENPQGQNVHSRRDKYRKQQKQQFQLKCYICGGPHMARNCPRNKNKSAAVCTTIAVAKTLDQSPKQLCETCQSIEFEPHCMVKVEGQSVEAIRDTGSTMSIVKKDLVPQQCYTGEVKEVSLASSTVKRTLPVANLMMETPYFSDRTDVLVMEKPVCPVLISNTRKLSTEETTKVPVYPVQAAAVGDKSQRPLKPKTTALGAITPDVLKKEQEEDPTLAKLFEIAKKPHNTRVTKGGTEFRYVVKNGILYRKVKNPSSQCNQVIVPKKLRNG